MKLRHQACGHTAPGAPPGRSHDRDNIHFIRDGAAVASPHGTLIVITRPETASDIAAIDAADRSGIPPYATQRPHRTVHHQGPASGRGAVRIAGSQVVIRHVAVSPVTLSNGTQGWFGLWLIAGQPQAVVSFHDAFSARA
tara:strand:- start:188 stop:607 length:420 start_codon:yes stop_codon:yes gene_type:complete